MFAFRIGAATNVGAQRKINQDSYAIRPGVAVVADGMGGHRGGETASAIAVDEVITRFDQPELERLVSSVEQANRRILDHAADSPHLHGMGTTVVALGFIEVEDRIALGAINVGDSRMYRLTGSVLQQLTEDHSLVETLVREGRITAAEAEVHPQRNIVTRALGVTDDVEIDSFHFIPKLGDRYLLSSDGLFNEVDAQQIASILANESDPQLAADALIDAANAGGGRDNITAVIVEIVETKNAAMPATPTYLADPEFVPAPVDPESTEPITMDTPVVDEATSSSKPRWSWRR